MRAKKLSTVVEKKKTKAQPKSAVAHKRVIKKKTSAPVREMRQEQGMPPVISVEELFLPAPEKHTWFEILHDGRVYKTTTTILNRVVLVSSIAVYIIAFILAGVSTFAQGMPTGLGNDQLINAGQVASYTVDGSAANIGTVVAKFIEFFFGALGVLFAGYIFYGGFSWVTAAGDEKKVASARGIIFHSILGLIVCAASFSIASFWIGAIGTAVAP